jgi:hypothetical protein
VLAYSSACQISRTPPPPACQTPLHSHSVMGHPARPSPLNPEQFLLDYNEPRRYWNVFLLVTFRVLTAESVKVTAFWGTETCSVVKTDRRFGSEKCLHHQDDDTSSRDCTAQSSFVFPFTANKWNKNFFNCCCLWISVIIIENPCHSMQSFWCWECPRPGFEHATGDTQRRWPNSSLWNLTLFIIRKVALTDTV